ncbi:MAG: DUF3300 domain-containing protein [Burkholderiaceae bacterium]|nr:DUF3300 domain-containing protein [Burkholderiaceae bacterium]MCD8516128.1 DUF3300 domain-containing protein [Burkholderiaceae bacterium]MCD8536289.1 DUF3300 domain-containing protein [Burkholderiaceae bacterium]MCD8564760.1 DUF3300 domain-containing protein [Burkholderiaceae bacterium]
MSKPQRPFIPSVRLIALAVCATFVLPSMLPYPTSVAMAQSSGQQASTQQLSQAQLASLVAPIALYPDPLVAQILMASTYPLEVAEAYNWQKSNEQLKGTALNNALKQQTWDASVKSLVTFPAVLGMMGSQLSWTQQLGNAVLAQQKDVMAAIQDLRKKAQASGALKSTPQQTVSTEGSGSSSTVVIQPANPQVVYVPTYNPTVVYGGWPYPAYPPVSYYPPGYVAGTALLSFGVGMAVGAALWGGCHWGSGSITINNNNFNNFNRNTVNNWVNNNRSETSNWRADAQRVSQNRSSLENNPRVSAERDQLRQNLDRSGWMANNDDRRSDMQDAARNAGDRRDNFRDAGSDHFGDFSRDRGFGDVSRARFGGGEHFGGFGGGHFGGFRR